MRHLTRPLWFTLVASPSSYSLATLIIMSINVNVITKKHTQVHFKGNVRIFPTTSASVSVDKFELTSQWKAWYYYYYYYYYNYYYFKILNTTKSPTKLIGKQHPKKKVRMAENSSDIPYNGARYPFSECCTGHLDLFYGVMRCSAQNFTGILWNG